MPMRQTLLATLALLGAVACTDKAAGPEGPSATAASETNHGSFRVWGPDQVILGNSALVGATFATTSNDTTPALSASWTSRDPGVATVAGRGAYADLAAVALGTTWVVASADGSVDSLAVAVVLEGSGGETDTSTVVGSGPVASVSLAIFPSSVSVGDSAGGHATVFDADGVQLVGRSITWTISDASVAAIEWQGGANVILRAMRAGTATLTATSEGKAGSAVLTVH